MSETSDVDPILKSTLEVWKHPSEAINFSTANTFLLLHDVINDGAGNSGLRVRLVNKLIERWNIHVLDKYERGYRLSEIGYGVTPERAVSDLVNSESAELKGVEPVKFNNIEVLWKPSDLTPALLEENNEAWMYVMHNWWSELTPETQKYLINNFGTPLVLPKTSLGIYSNEISVGQCYDVEHYMGRLRPNDAVILNNMVYEEETEHRGGGLMVTDKFMVGEWGGLVLPWVYYEPSAMTKLRLRAVLLAQRFGVVNGPTRLFTESSSALHWLKMGRPVGADWRLELMPERTRDCKNSVSRLLAR